MVNLTRQNVEYNIRLGPNKHSPGDAIEVITVERVAIENEAVQAEIAKLQLPEGAEIVVDPWIYGTR